MAGFVAGLLQVLVLIWRRGQSVLDVDFGENLLPKIEFTIDDIANALQEFQKSSADGNKIRSFVETMHTLYYDWSRDANNPNVDMVVPFHNWDHGRNVWSFAQWYVSNAKDITKKEDKLLVAVAALAHDVMHPGTPNNKKTVDETFLPQVQRKFQNTWNLEEYAVQLLEKTQLGRRMRVALGCNIKSCGQLSDAEVLTDRAPQEVLHSWITMEVLEQAGLSNSVKVEEIVASILMTSIKAHFDVLFHNGFPPQFPADHEAIKDHVRDCAEHEKFGLLLHFFDMGYVCQTGINRDTPLIGHTFAARYLIESKNMGNLRSWSEVMNGQVGFANGTVAKYLANLKEFNVISDEMFGIFRNGIDQFLNRIGTIKDLAQLEASRRENGLLLTKDEKNQIANWKNQ